jgi:hypothetical protein
LRTGPETVSLGVVDLGKRIANGPPVWAIAVARARRSSVPSRGEAMTMLGISRSQVTS